MLNLDGSVQWEKTAPVDSVEDIRVSPLKMEYPYGLDPGAFHRLTLTSGTDIVSENFYWRGLKNGDYRALRDLPKVKVEASTHTERQGSTGF